MTVMPHPLDSPGLLSRSDASGGYPPTSGGVETMAEILLAHPFFLKNDPKQVQKMRPYPPLGTLYAASNLRGRGHSVGLFDAMLSDGLHEYEEALARERPAVVVLYEDQFNFL